MLRLNGFLSSVTKYICISFFVYLSGCASLPEGFNKTASFAVTDTSNTKLGQWLEPDLDARQGQSGFYLLPEGEDAFAARLLLIEDSEKTIDVQYYIWHNDTTGKLLYSHLLDAADRGVRVRLLLDDLDTAGKDSALRLIDAHANIEIRLFNPFSNRNSRAAGFISDTARVNRRMHNKSMTFDNQVSIFGGRNIGDEYFNAAAGVGFKDLDAISVGPVVQEVSISFDHYWNSQWVYPLSAFYRDAVAPSEHEVNEFRDELREFIITATQSSYAAAIRSLALVERTEVSQFDFQWGRWMLVYDDPAKVEAKQVKFDTHLGPKLKKAFDAAKSEIIIVSPYFVPGPEFTQYLIDRVSDGVGIKVMTNSLAANDVPMVHAGYMRYREQLISGGVEIYELKTTETDENKRELNEGQRATWAGSSRASLHAKYFSFDNQYLFVGSFNLDNRSVALNTELGVYFESKNYADLIREGFKNNAIRLGYHVTLDDAGDLKWTTIVNGKEVFFDKEPDTGFWKRFGTGFLSFIVPESQL